MNTIYVFGNIFIGVTSGVITSILLWVSYKIFYLKVLLSWLQERIYEGVIIEGSWGGGHSKKEVHEILGKPEKTHTFEPRIDMHMNILEQKGHNITGVFHAESYNKAGEQTKYINDYEIKGNIIGNYVVINYRALSKKRAGLGSFVLEIKDGGRELQGGVSFVSEDDMEIGTLEKVSLRREEN